MKEPELGGIQSDPLEVKPLIFNDKNLKPSEASLNSKIKN